MQGQPRPWGPDDANQTPGAKRGPVHVEGIQRHIQFPGSGPRESWAQPRLSLGLPTECLRATWQLPTRNGAQRPSRALQATRGRAHLSGGLAGCLGFTGFPRCPVQFSPQHTQAQKGPLVLRTSGTGSLGWEAAGSHLLATLSKQPPPPRSLAARGDEESPAASLPDRTHKPRTDTRKDLEHFGQRRPPGKHGTGRDPSVGPFLNRLQRTQGPIYSQAGGYKIAPFLKIGAKSGNPVGRVPLPAN